MLFRARRLSLIFRAAVVSISVMVLPPQVSCHTADEGGTTPTVTGEPGRMQPSASVKVAGSKVYENVGLAPLIRKWMSPLRERDPVPPVWIIPL